MLQDLRFGLKLLWKEKAFTATALLTLALPIGANTAIFTALSAVILDPLPFPEPGRLVTLYNVYPGVGVTDRGANGVPDYLDRKQMTDVFDSVALLGNSGYDVGREGSPRRITGEYVTPSYFRVLRVSPLLGRAFAEEDAGEGKDKLAILSYGLWSAPCRCFICSGATSTPFSGRPKGPARPSAAPCGPARPWSSARFHSPSCC